MSYQLVHEMVVGDTYLPLGATLKRNNQAVDLTGLTVQFKLVADDGTVKRDWSAASIVSAEDGQVQYDFASADVDTAGIYWAWFRYGDGGEWVTYPAAGRDGKARSLKVVINAAA